MMNRHREQINFNEMNLQHSRLAKENLMQIIVQENKDMVVALLWFRKHIGVNRI